MGISGGELRVGPWHQVIDILVEMAVGAFREQVEQISMWSNTTQLQVPIRDAKRAQLRPPSS